MRVIVLSRAANAGWESRRSSVLGHSTGAPAVSVAWIAPLLASIVSAALRDRSCAWRSAASCRSATTSMPSSEVTTSESVVRNASETVYRLAMTADAGRQIRNHGQNCRYQGLTSCSVMSNGLWGRPQETTGLADCERCIVHVGDTERDVHDAIRVVTMSTGAHR